MANPSPVTPSNPSSPSPPDLLPHTSHNPTAPSTLLLIHSAFTSRADWSLVLPYCPSTYHVLVPDLPGHGASAYLPYTLASAAEKLAELVRAKGKGGRAHVIGISLGANAALRLAAHHPVVVVTCVLSGFMAMGGDEGVGKWLPQALWLQDRAMRMLPSVILKGVKSGAEFDTGTPPPSRELIEAVAAPSPKPWPEKAWPARTLVFAAGKSGVLPTADSAEAARRLVEIGGGEGGDEGTQAWTHGGMRHPWHRQEPKVFAEMVCAWIEGKEMPEGFARL